jgi:hypothetical protein
MMKRLICLLFLMPMALNAATWFSDGSSASVQALYDQDATHDGDTITIPAGTFTWSTGVRFPRPDQPVKAITLQGAGAGSTIIKDNVQGTQLIMWTLAANANSRLTGIDFQDGGRASPAFAPGGVLHIAGDNRNGGTFRYDHCKQSVKGPIVCDAVIGVIDHNAFPADVWTPPIYPDAYIWNGLDFGDGAWADPTGFGTDRFLFIEDNVFTKQTPATYAITDSEGGGRFVIRYNQILNGGLVANHGTESTGRPRGGRAIEVYNNTFEGGGINKFVGDLRSGCLLFHDNTVSGYWGFLANYELKNMRGVWNFAPWGGADGTNPWDANDPTVYFTGTVTGVSGATVTIAGANFPNYSLYVLRRTSDVGGSGTINYAEIDSNTATTMTYKGSGYGPAMSCAIGDTIQVRKVNFALDQPGRARGSLVTGNPPVVPGGWNNQVTEPCYSWNNRCTDNGNANVPIALGAGVKNNGIMVNGSAMPEYTPYTYPHPLVSGASPTPTATASPSATATATATETPTATASPSATATATATASPSHP